GQLPAHLARHGEGEHLRQSRHPPAPGAEHTRPYGRDHGHRLRSRLRFPAPRIRDAARPRRLPVHAVDQRRGVDGPRHRSAGIAGRHRRAQPMSSAIAVPMARFLAANINVERKLFGLTFDLDTLWATLAAIVIVIGLGLYLRSKATAGVPGKLQLVWEMGVSAVRKQVDGAIGPCGAAIVPLAVTLFVFILVANWFEDLGIGSDT